MKKDKKLNQFYIIFFLLPFLFMACGDGSGGNGDDGGNNIDVQAIRSGQWSGTAGFGEVEFEVTSDGAGINSFKVIFLDFVCGTVTHGGSITLNFVPKQDIVNRKIDFDIRLGGLDSSDSISIEGTFDTSGDNVSGTFELDSNAAVCSGSWDAQPI